MRISDWSSDVCSSDLLDRRVRQCVEAEDIGRRRLYQHIGSRHAAARVLAGLRLQVTVEGLDATGEAGTIVAGRVEKIATGPCVPAHSHWWLQRATCAATSPRIILLGRSQNRRAGTT